MTDGFGHIPEDIRGKVAHDLLRYVKADGSWDFGAFNPENDYQRHLYALFLRQAGYGEADLRLALSMLCWDVSPDRRDSYISDIIHSTIVGIPNEAGTCLPVYGEVKEHA